MDSLSQIGGALYAWFATTHAGTMIAVCGFLWLALCVMALLCCAGIKSTNVEGERARMRTWKLACTAITWSMVAICIHAIVVPVKGCNTCAFDINTNDPNLVSGLLWLVVVPAVFGLVMTGMLSARRRKGQVYRPPISR
jgi:hypothetical protein